ncbi:hypothetical protein L3X38_032916 [Prunus dulcis]|uniref:Uncharacterized protein n=1 Tax=Prunus dulcis TaxID=3755 RepID=A0AAD4YX41_PRUDU|nr:hypothetical protein L3X38_032916 [Prunus dulcis]
MDGLRTGLLSGNMSRNLDFPQFLPTFQHRGERVELSSLSSKANNGRRPLSRFDLELLIFNICNRTSVRRWRTHEPELHTYFVHGDLWESFKDWSVYALCRPIKALHKNKIMTREQNHNQVSFHRCTIVAWMLGSWISSGALRL